MRKGVTINLLDVWNEKIVERGGRFNIVVHGKTAKDTRYQVDFSLDASELLYIARQAMEAVATHREDLYYSMDEVRAIQ